MTFMNSSWIKWALILSLALNLIVLGFEIAQRTRTPPTLSGTAPPPPFHPRMLDNHISKETSQTVRRAMAKQRRDAKGALDELHRSRRVFYQALLESPLSGQQLDDSNQALLKASTEYMVISQNNMIEVIQSIPVEERLRVLNKIEKKFIAPQKRFKNRPNRQRDRDRPH
jgi:hypothetical protein